jgi:gamma-glutamyl phosphate reductase
VHAIILERGRGSVEAYINRDFEVDLFKAMEVFVSAKTRRADFGQF